MSNLIDELLRAYTMLDFSDDSNKELKKEYLDEVKEFALKGSYTSTKHKDYLLRNFMKPIQEQALDLNLSKAAVYKNRNLVLRDLESRLGKGIIKSILNSEFEHVDMVLQFNAVDQPLSNVIIPSVIDSINERSNKARRNSSSKYSLIDCSDEIRLLKKYAVLDLEMQLDNLDMDKLNYLLRLISFEESDVKDRIDLMKVIKK